MNSEGLHDVIMVGIAMNGNPIVETASFNSGRVYISRRNVYSNNGKFFINHSGRKKQVLKERNCFIFHEWTSIIMGGL